MIQPHDNTRRNSPCGSNRSLRKYLNEEGNKPLQEMVSVPYVRVSRKIRDKYCIRTRMDALVGRTTFFTLLMHPRSFTVFLICRICLSSSLTRQLSTKRRWTDVCTAVRYQGYGGGCFVERVVTRTLRRCCTCEKAGWRMIGDLVRRVFPTKFERSRITS